MTADQPDVILGKGGPSAYGYHKWGSSLECHKKYQLSEIRKIKIPLDQAPLALAVGAMFHAGRARWFANRFDVSAASWESIIAATKESMEELSAPCPPEAERKALDLLNQYFDHYGKKEKADPVAAEYLLQSKLDPDDPDEMMFSARLDDVSRYPEAGGRLCIGEGKTASDTANCLAEYRLHPQPLLQAALWKMSPEGESKYGPIAGVMLDVVRKPQNRKTGETKAGFMRTLLPINDRMLEWYMKSVREARRQTLSLDWNSDANRNTANCTRMYGRARVPCQYQELCMYGRNAAGLYQFEDGGEVSEWTSSPGKEVAPWD
jgi:hypothetical protein